MKVLDPANFAVFNGEALFDGEDAAGNLGLWESDGRRPARLN